MNKGKINKLIAPYIAITMIAGNVAPCLALADTESAVENENNKDTIHETSPNVPQPSDSEEISDSNNPTEVDTEVGEEVSSEAIVFADAKLEKLVRDALKMPTEPITKEFAKTVKDLQIRDFDSKSPSNLAGLEFFTNLEKLSINIQATSAPQLESLTKLKELSLYGNLVDVSHISGLETLTYLRVDGSVANINPIAGLTNLVTLDLSSNNVANLAPLANLSNLKILNLSSNKVANLEPISGLVKLEELYLSYNSVKTASALSNLINLQKISLSENNEILELPDLSKLTNLKELYLNGCSKLKNIGGVKENTAMQKLDISSTSVENVDALKKLTSLITLTASFADLTDITGLPVSETLKTVKINGNYIKDISPLANLSQLVDIDLSSNRISNADVFKSLPFVAKCDLASNYIPVWEEEALKVVQNISGVRYNGQGFMVDEIADKDVKLGKGDIFSPKEKLKAAQKNAEGIVSGANPIGHNNSFKYVISDEAILGVDKDNNLIGLKDGKATVDILYLGIDSPHTKATINVEVKGVLVDDNEDVKSGTINVKHINKLTGREIAPSEQVKDVEFGKSRVVSSKLITGFTLSSEESSKTITLSKDNPVENVVFEYLERENAYEGAVKAEDYESVLSGVYSGINVNIGNVRISLVKDTIVKLKGRVPDGFDIRSSNLVKNEKLLSDVATSKGANIISKYSVSSKALGNSIGDLSKFTLKFDKEKAAKDSEVFVYKINDDGTLKPVGGGKVEEFTSITNSISFESAELGEFVVLDKSVDDTKPPTDGGDNDNDNDNGGTKPPTDDGDNDNDGVKPPTDNGNGGGTKPPTDNGNGGGTKPPTDNGNGNGGGTKPPTDNGNGGGTKPPSDNGGKLPNTGGLAGAGVIASMSSVAAGIFVMLKKKKK